MRIKQNVISMHEEKPIQVSIRFVPEMYQQIEQLAKVQERSFNQQVVWLVKSQLAQEEKQPKR